MPAIPGDHEPIYLFVITKISLSPRCIFISRGKFDDSAQVDSVTSRLILSYNFQIIVLELTIFCAREAYRWNDLNELGYRTGMNVFFSTRGFGIRRKIQMKKKIASINNSHNWNVNSRLKKINSRRLS